VSQPPGTTPPADGAPGALTVREREVLAASACGLSVVAVARSLGLAPEDVRATIASATQKLAVHSKVEAIHLAYADGLIDLPAPGRSMP
jgi:DNA-binding NarL/FixJ family response regulator